MSPACTGSRVVYSRFNPTWLNLLRNGNEAKVSIGQIAALIVAAVAVVLTLFLIAFLVKLMRTLDTTTRTIQTLNGRAEPLLTELERTLANANVQLHKIDVLIDQVSSLTKGVSTATSLIAGSVTNPLVKAASFAYGLRKIVRSRRGEVKAVAVKAHDTLQTKGGAPL